MDASMSIDFSGMFSRSKSTSKNGSASSLPPPITAPPLTRLASSASRDLLTPTTSMSNASSSVSTPTTKSPSSGIVDKAFGRAPETASSPSTVSGLSMHAASPSSQSPRPAFPFDDPTNPSKHRPNPSTSTARTDITTTSSHGSANFSHSFFDDPSPARPRSQADTTDVIRLSRSNGTERAPSISSSYGSSVHTSHPNQRVVPNGENRSNSTGRARKETSEIRMGYLAAMDTMKYIGHEKAADVMLSLRVLAPFCDLLHERMAWASGLDEADLTSASGYRRDMPEGGADVIVIGRIEDEAEDEAARRTESNRRAALLASGLTEQDLPRAEAEAYRILTAYTLLKMNRHCSGKGRVSKASAGKTGSGSGSGQGGPSGLPMLKPKEAVEVAGKLEALEEGVTRGDHGYLPLFDLVRWQCYLPPRLASPFHSIRTVSASRSSSISGSASQRSASITRPAISINILEAFDMGGVTAPQGRRRGSEGLTTAVTSGHSVSQSSRTPERTRSNGDRGRPHTADSDGSPFKLRSFGQGGKSKSNPALSGKISSHRSGGSIVDLNSASDDEEFGSPGPFPTGSPESTFFNTAVSPGMIRKMPSAGRLRQGIPALSAFRPPSRSAADGFYIPGSGHNSTTSVDETLPGVLVNGVVSGYSSPKQNQITLPAGPSSFRLPMARQDSATFGSLRSTSAGSGLSTMASEHGETGMRRADSSEDIYRIASELPSDGTRTPPDLSVPPRARRRELLIAAGLVPIPDVPITSPLAPPPLPESPMPVGLAGPPSAPIPLRRPRNRAGSEGSASSSLAGLGDDTRRRAIIILDQAEDEQDSPSSLDSGRTFSGVVASSLRDDSPERAVETMWDDEAAVGVAISPEDSPHQARPGRIKTAEQMLAAMTSRRSSLARSEPEPPASGHPSSNSSTPGPSTLASRRLSDLVEEDDGEEVGECCDFQDAAARRHTAGTQFSGDSQYAATSPSMTTGSSSNRNSRQFSSASHDSGETFSACGYPQTPQLPNGFATGYGRGEDPVEAGKQMLYEVFGDGWDENKQEDDVGHGLREGEHDDHRHSRLERGKVQPGDEVEAKHNAKERPESMLYPFWV